MLIAALRGNKPGMNGRASAPCLAAARLATLLSALLLACTLRIDIPSQPCGGDGPYTYIEAHLVSGSVTFPLPGGESESWAVTGGAVPNVSGACAATFGSTLWRPPPLNLPRPSWAKDDGYLRLYCPNGPWQVLLIHGIVAPQLSSGTHISPTTPADPSFTPTFDSDSGWPTTCSSAPAYRISAEVTRARGGALPYPDMVTPAYLRNLTIRLDGVTDPSAACAMALPTIQLSFTESAGDVVHQPGYITCP